MKRHQHAILMGCVFVVWCILAFLLGIMQTTFGRIVNVAFILWCVVIVVGRLSIKEKS